MATAPMSSGQMKDLAAAVLQAIPSDLPADTAQKWIGRKSELGNRLRAILLAEEVNNLPDINWALVYGKLGMSAEYAEFAKVSLAKTDPNIWFVPVVKGATCNKVVEVMKKLDVNFYLYTQDLDASVTVNDRDPNRDGSYSVSFKRTEEADEENKNLSANTLAKRNHKGITLLERLLLELGYFLATGKHLDEKCWTLCSGSRCSGGVVPCVGWYSGSRGVVVYWDGLDDSRDDLRSRSVVS